MKVIQVFTDFPNKYQPYNERLVQSLLASDLDVIIVALNNASIKKYGNLPIVTTGSKNIVSQIGKKIYTRFKILFAGSTLKGLSRKQQLLLFEKYGFVEKHLDGVFHFHKIQSITKFLLTYLIENKIKYIVSLRGYDITVYPFLSKDNMKFTRRVLQNAWKIHSVCDSLKCDALKISEVKSSIIHTIYRTPNIKDTFQAPIVPTLPDEINICTISRIHWKKCISESLGAIRDLRNMGYNVKYYVLGGFQGYENERLLYLVRKMNLEDSVILMGYVEENTFEEHIKNMHIFWLPTVNEGIPNTLYYILKCGFPIVASATDGIPEVVKHGRNGLLFEPYNFNNLVNQTERFIKDDTLRTAVQLEARNTELQTSEMEMSQYLSLYTDVIE